MAAARSLRRSSLHATNIKRKTAGKISYIELRFATMAKLDLLLTLVFGTLALLGVAGAALSFRQAMHVAGEKNGDFKMFLWAVGSLIGLIVAGVSTAYILLPLFFAYT
jgi:hypothetical protein